MVFRAIREGSVVSNRVLSGGSENLLQMKGVRRFIRILESFRGIRSILL